ncbi:hypothetical protein D3C73_499320 [compost metagenome]
MFSQFPDWIDRRKRQYVADNRLARITRAGEKKRRERRQARLNHARYRGLCPACGNQFVEPEQDRAAAKKKAAATASGISHGIAQSGLKSCPMLLNGFESIFYLVEDVADTLQVVVNKFAGTGNLG